MRLNESRLFLDKEQRHDVALYAVTGTWLRIRLAKKGYRET